MARVLVIDDDSSIRMVMKRVLVQAGHEVRELDCGNDVAQILDAWHPELVTVDIMMPGVMGQAVYNLLRGKAGVNLPIIVCSATNLKFRGASDDSFLAYLPKPIKPAEFVEAVEKLLTLREAGLQPPA